MTATRVIFESSTAAPFVAVLRERVAEYFRARRLSPRADYRWYHRFQPLYAFILYSFSTLFWVFVKDYKYFLQPDLGPYKNHRPSTSEVVTLLLGKALYYGWTIVVPLLVLDLA